MPETGGGGVDQAGKPLVQGLPAITQSGHGAGPEILDDDVGLGQQALEQRPIGIGLEVERDAFLAAVERGEIGRFAIDEGAVVAGIVAARRLHLDDPGTQIGEHHRTVGTGQHAGEVDDGDPVKRAGHGGGGSLIVGDGHRRDLAGPFKFSSPAHVYTGNGIARIGGRSAIRGRGQ